jgi:hypothetical protein
MILPIWSALATAASRLLWSLEIIVVGKASKGILVDHHKTKISALQTGGFWRLRRIPF